MGTDSIRVNAVIDEKLFLSFAFYDTFICKKRWRLPVCFMLLMSASAAGCLLLRERGQQAWLLAAVLLLLGFGLPLCYAFSFLLSVLAQIKRMDLKHPGTAYVLTLTREKLMVSKAAEKAEYPWGELYAVVPRKKCTYLYVTPGKAYLLPHAQAGGGPEALEAFLESCAALKKRRTT